MEIERVFDPDEIKKVIPVIRSAWGMNNMEQLVKDIIAAMRFHGGLVLVAKEDKDVIGMQFSFVGQRHGFSYLYSHMTGVLDEKKYSGVGLRLKLKQKEWAIENGFDLIAWTYDPLMSLNANFNVHKLGAISRTYLRNFYGEMEDALNIGIPTDRLVAEWWIKRVNKIKTTPKATLELRDDTDALLLEDLPESIAFKIPSDFISIKKSDHDLAMNIRLITRKRLEKLFELGFIIIDFERERSSYIMIKNNTLKENYGTNIFK